MHAILRSSTTRTKTRGKFLTKKVLAACFLFFLCYKEGCLITVPLKMKKASRTSLTVLMYFLLFFRPIQPTSISFSEDARTSSPKREKKVSCICSIFFTKHRDSKECFLNSQVSFGLITLTMKFVKSIYFSLSGCACNKERTQS